MILEGRKIELRYKLTDEFMMNNISWDENIILWVIKEQQKKCKTCNNSLYIRYKTALIKGLINVRKQISSQEKRRLKDTINEQQTIKNVAKIRSNKLNYNLRGTYWSVYYTTHG